MNAVLEHRRRLMEMGGLQSAVKSGTLTLSAASSTVLVEHNLGSGNYIVLLMQLNPDLTQNGSIGGVLHKGFDFDYAKSAYKVAHNGFETRTTWATYSTSYERSGSSFADYALLNSCEFVRARSNGYNYPIGTYKWAAFDLSKVADYSQQITLSDRTRTITVNHNLDTYDVLVYILCTNPIYNTNAWLGVVFSNDFFAQAKVPNANTTKPTYYYQTGTSTNYQDCAHCDMSSFVQTQTANSIVMSTEYGTYPFMAGNYDIKVYKLPQFS